MKKFKARKEREQQEAIVRRRLEIEDPSAELFSESRPWQFDDPLQDSFLEQPENKEQPKDYHRIPKLKFRSTQDELSAHQPLSSSQPELSIYRRHISGQYKPRLDDPTPALFDLSSISYNADPEMVAEEYAPESPTVEPPALPERHPNHTHSIPIPPRSVSSARDTYSLSVSPLKTDFQLFSLRCAPSPVSTSPKAATPIFELSAEEASCSIAGAMESGSPVELDGSPVEALSTPSTPLHSQSKQILDLEPEPEASPYNRFTTFAKSIHALNANLSPIEETEEEAASRRSSVAQVYELVGITPITSFPPSSYAGGTSIHARNQRLPAITTTSEPSSAPLRNTSTRSSESRFSTNSMHSMFSFEYSNSDTEKIYVSPVGVRRESSAPSLTDVSSVDDFDIDFDLDWDARRSQSISKRDAKLERFFGIRQYSVGPESDSGLDSMKSPASSSDSFPEYTSGNDSTFRPSASIDDLDLSLALEHDPYKREIISIHKSILSKSQNKQDAKLEKFFGCDKDQIQIARKSSTGSRLAGCTDDLKFRTIGW